MDGSSHVSDYWIMNLHIWKGQSYSVELDLEVIPIEGHKTHIILYLYIHTHKYIYIAISILTDMDTDKGGCVRVYTHVHTSFVYWKCQEPKISQEQKNPDLGIKKKSNFDWL